MATTTAKKTAKKTARKKTSTRTSAKRTTTRTAPKKAAPLTEREPKVVLEDAGYAAAGFAHDVVELARTLPTRLEKLRATDRDALLSQLTTLLDSKAAEGRKVAADVKKDTRVKKILEQTGNTRSQVKAAVTSVRKTADVSLVAGRSAGRKQAGNATSQVKAAVTSLRRSGATVADAASKTIQN
ncbi:MAG TPA: hypothetical protein VK906_05180 [Egicoccus sp.]|nr:hypothetical protein [Egicoccus sp.]HSK22544.1 hypothetical protein [Egicoccus sp.]